MSIPSQIKAFSNCDHAIVAWRYESMIPNCIGFALYKLANKDTPEAAEPLPNRIGFAGQSPKPGEQRPSTEWPIQRFTWTDYDVNLNDQVRYMVIPMLWNGTAVVKDIPNQSGWSPPVIIHTQSDFQAYFNRGIISSQFMSRQLATLQQTDKSATLDNTLKDEESTIRKFLGGVLAQQLFSEMDTVIQDPTLSIYASLYELNEEILIGKFKEIGERANIILANGAFQKQPHNDENYEVREDLKTNSKVKVYDRIVTSNHFAHNKFIIFCKKQGSKDIPYKVWTGSTNTTQNGLYTQVNNAVIINNAQVAAWYLDEWDEIQKAASGYPKEYIDYNSNGHPQTFQMRTWFAPVSAQQDLIDARKLIDNAREGILFLFFSPGTHDTLYNEIVGLIGKAGEPDLFIHGIMNQDPGGKVNPLVFIHKGNTHSTNFDTILPKSIHDEFAYWADEISPKMVTIHSKVVVIDPFGKNPVVMTGSHNLGPKASQFNDDNLNIILGNQALAIQYAVNILSVYDHYHWRYSLANNHDPSKVYQGLSTDKNWMTTYLTGGNLDELNFMLGKTLPQKSAIDQKHAHLKKIP